MKPIQKWKSGNRAAFSSVLPAQKWVGPAEEGGGGAEKEGKEGRDW